VEAKVPETTGEDKGADHMKQVTILSGKGGTGKTTITASFIALSDNAVSADCDVDASNLHLLLNPEIKETIEFKGLNVAEINSEKCTECGRCIELCRFNAIKDYRIDPIHCEGCKVCVVNCPVEAIEFKERICGHAYISETKHGPMSHARLTPGMENSGKLVTLVRQNASKLAEEQGKDLVLIDGSPGIGCPVIASIANVEYAVVVVEPTLSGIHDLKRVLELVYHFEVTPLVIINKYDINRKNTNALEDYCRENSITLLGKIPFDPAVTNSMVMGIPVVEYDPKAASSRAIKKTWKRFKEALE
jgi:MinD superfamily P-loop ATPase